MALPPPLQPVRRSLRPESQAHLWLGLQPPLWVCPSRILPVVPPGGAWLVCGVGPNASGLTQTLRIALCGRDREVVLPRGQ